MKKKLLFTCFQLRVGGVQKALINMLNNIDYKKNDVTLIVQIKDGEFSDQINENVKVIYYKFSKLNNKLFRKIGSLINFFKLVVKNYHKYDFAGCFEPGYKPSSILALCSSKNNAAWMHTNVVEYMKYSNWFNEIADINIRAKKFCKRMYFNKFKKNIFVSYDSLNAYKKLYPKNEHKMIMCHNLIDYKSILKQSNEKIPYQKSNVITFLNISRHTNFDKKISDIINACEKLKKEKYQFRIFLGGSGEDHEYYKTLVKEKKLEKEIVFLGFLINPMPYYKISDCFILSSRFEGYPVVFNEAMSLNIPIITTNVSDALTEIKDKYGIVNDDIYLGMKEFLDKGYNIKKKFNPIIFNKESMETLSRMFNNEI